MDSLGDGSGPASIDEFKERTKKKKEGKHHIQSQRWEN